MKQVFTKIALVMMIGLTGCSSNTQKENTGIGVATGAVVGGLAGSLVGGGTGKAIAIGAGIVAGALIGGSVGSSMDSTDNSKTYNVINTNKTNQTTKWVNSKTGVAYTMTPTSEFFTVNGNPNCRHYHFTATKQGKTSSYNGIACYRKDGSWYSVK
jgi:surface antigen